MLRESALSVVNEDSKKFIGTLGAADTARLDEYFTGIRQLEKQLALQLQKPPANEACRVPVRPASEPDIKNNGMEVEVVQATHKIMAQMLAMAAACNQTKILNMVYSDHHSHLHKAGESFNHHNLTHEEPANSHLGYQPETYWFGTRAMDALADYISAFAAIKEGDGTLLDNSLIFAYSESSNARIHSLDGIPIMFVGKAGGRAKPNIHVMGKGDPITRVGLTAMQVMGLPIDTWGTQSLRTSKSISEVMA
jgi:hypothetical protein